MDGLRIDSYIDEDELGETMVFGDVEVNAVGCKFLVNYDGYDGFPKKRILTFGQVRSLLLDVGEASDWTVREWGDCISKLQGEID